MRIPYSLTLELGVDGEPRDDAAIERVQCALANPATHRDLEEHFVYGESEAEGWEACVELFELVPAGEWPEPYALRGERYDDPRGTVRLATFDALRTAEAAFVAECAEIDRWYGKGAEA